MKEQVIKTEFSDSEMFRMSDILTTFAMMENAGSSKIDYGNGVIYTPAEVHTISFIADHPGCSNTDISKKYNKTLGATSQVLTRLKKKELIETRKNKDNHKTLEIYLSQKGEELNMLHHAYDVTIWKDMVKFLKERFSIDEIDAAFEVMEYILHYGECVQNGTAE